MDKGRKRGCTGCGCQVLGALLILVLLAGGWLVAVHYQVPEKLGLRQAPVERLDTDVPDRQTAEALEAEMAAAGMDMQGVSVMVLPYKDGSGSLAVAVLDAGDGFHFGGSDTGGADAGSADTGGDVTAYLEALAAGGADNPYGIKRAAIQYVDAEGNALITMTADAESIGRFARGEIDRDTFLAAVEGRVDLVALAKGGLP